MLMLEIKATHLKDLVWGTSKILAACMLAVAAVSLASCVASETPLVAGSKPILGPQFNMVLYRDFSPGNGFGAQEVAYRWLDGSYVRNSATTNQFVRIAAEPLSGDDLLMQRSRADRADGTANLYDYWIARKITDGTYLFFP